MVTIFWDSEGVILVDFLDDQRTVNEAYYETALKKLHDALLKNRPGKMNRQILFHRNNASAHSSKLSRAVLREFRRELLLHPPCSPDLAPFVFFLFFEIKRTNQRNSVGVDI